MRGNNCFFFSFFSFFFFDSRIRQTPTTSFVEYTLYKSNRTFAQIRTAKTVLNEDTGKRTLKRLLCPKNANF